jgi:hypothetical protein
MTLGRAWGAPLLVLTLSGCGKGTADQNPAAGVPLRSSPKATPDSVPQVSIRPFPRESRVERPVALRAESQRFGEQRTSEVRAEEGARPASRTPVPRGAVGGE